MNGEKMTIAYFEPLSRAWQRMKQALFNPFNLNKWFIIGFNAFLAGLLKAAETISPSASFSTSLIVVGSG
jgi:hypothetical protein